MTTREAIQEMLNGKKVRGIEWENGYYVTFVDNVGFIDENLAITDITIEDKWEIYKEPKQKQVVVIEKWLIFDKITKSYSIAEESNIEEFLKDDRDYLSKVKLIDTYTYEVEP